MRFRVSGKELEILEARCARSRLWSLESGPVTAGPWRFWTGCSWQSRRTASTGTGGTMAPSSAWLARSRRRPAFAGPLALTLGTRQGMCPPGSGRTPCTSGPIRKKGAALLAGLPLEEGEESAVAAAQERTRSILNRLPLRELTTEGFGREEAMLELFHRPEWDQLSESCLGCGACTFACPTCQCYDIKEFTGNQEILRYRCWDSCMYSDFTIMSAGQPRPTQKERFRQRFLHKLQYFPVNQGGFSAAWAAAGACGSARYT